MLVNKAEDTVGVDKEVVIINCTLACARVCVREREREKERERESSYTRRIAIGVENVQA